MLRRARRSPLRLTKSFVFITISSSRVSLFVTRSRPRSRAVENSRAASSAATLNFVPSTSTLQAKVSTTNGRAASWSTSNIASPESFTRRVLPNRSGYSSRAPAFRQTVVPSCNVMSTRCPAGAAIERYWLAVFSMTTLREAYHVPASSSRAAAACMQRRTAGR